MSACMAAHLGPAPGSLPDLRCRCHGRHLAGAGPAAPQNAPKLPQPAQPGHLEQSIAFGLGSGLGYTFIVFIVREGRRRLRSKAVPAIFQGLPSSMIYIGVLSLAIYALVGHSVVL